MEYVWFCICLRTEQFELASVPVVVLDLIHIFFRAECSGLPHDFAFVSCHMHSSSRCMASFIPAQDSIAETEQSRLNKIKKDCEISAVRGLCMNEPRPRFTLRHLCCEQWMPQKKKIPPHLMRLWLVIMLLGEIQINNLMISFFYAFGLILLGNVKLKQCTSFCQFGIVFSVYTPVFILELHCVFFGK